MSDTAAVNLKEHETPCVHMYGFERRIEKIFSIAVDFNQKPNAMIEITSGKVKTYGSPLSFK
jgi:hypothetical protein